MLQKTTIEEAYSCSTYAYHAHTWREIELQRGKHTHVQKHDQHTTSTTILTFFGRYLKMSASAETSCIPNMEQRLATMAPLPEPGPPEHHWHNRYKAAHALDTSE